MLIPTGALLNAHHPLSPLPHSPSTLSSQYLRVSYGLPPSLSVTFFPPPPPWSSVKFLLTLKYWELRVEGGWGRGESGWWALRSALVGMSTGCCMETNLTINYILKKFQSLLKPYQVSRTSSQSKWGKWDFQVSRYGKRHKAYQIPSIVDSNLYMPLPPDLNLWLLNKGAFICAEMLRVSITFKLSHI